MHTPAPDRRRVVGTVVALLATAAMAGCGLRLETEPPEPPVPDALEIVRDRAAVDAVRISELAERAAPATPDPVAEVLAGVVEASGEHAAALGGPYVPFPDAPPDPDGEPTPEPPPPPVGAAEVITLLTTTAARALDDADATEDGTFARLLTSVALSRLLLADAVTAAVGDPVEPEESAEVPGLVPDGVTGQQVGVLVQSEDALGLAWEVLAARFQGEDRQAAAARATVHRLRAQDWAVASGIAGTGQDPRRSTYALPPELTDPEAAVIDLLGAAAELEEQLARGYLTILADAAAGSRSPLADLALDCLRRRPAGAAPVPAFPGLGEPAAGAGQS